MNSNNYKRVVIKAGTALITDKSGTLNLGFMENLVEEISALKNEGIEVILVSSGAVAAGRAVIRNSDQKNVPFRQVLAAAGQGRLIHVYGEFFSSRDLSVAQALLTRSDFSVREKYLNIRNTLLSLIDLNLIPIINENDVVAVDELHGETFGDNDTLSAMVANLIDADLLIMLGVVGGLYTSDPNLDSSAVLVENVASIDENIEAMGGESLDTQGRGGMITKLSAAKLATKSGVDTVIASGLQENILSKLLSGSKCGTFFPADVNKIESRKRWMISALSNSGQITIDEGALVAIQEKSGSLLSVGIKNVTGSFNRGDIVSIVGPNLVSFAVGITDYDSGDIIKIMGKRSEKFDELLGYNYGEEVIHRNNMVLI
ncbi:MAG: glutamate 5-kinase [SAR202 cluster bacterium]|nr:glutamate 5-kinase [SAR202 cluster bacterium]